MDAAAAGAHHRHPTYGQGPLAYARVLATHHGFRNLFLGELLNSGGGWFAYVATLRRVADLAPPAQQGRLLSAVLLSHYIPTLLTFPIAGVLADRAPRELVMVASCAVGAAAAACLTFVRGPGDLAFMLALLVLQHGAQSVYEPAKRAILPALLPVGDSEALRLATTLDSVGWSLMGALGSSAGGLALGAWGYSTCYAIDAASYVAAGVAALSLRGQVRPRGGGGGAPGRDGGGGVELAAASLSPARLAKARQSDGVEAAPGAPSPGTSPARRSGGGPGATLAAAFSGAAADVRAGIRYLAHPAHRPIAIIAGVKGAGAFLWGPADVMNTVVSALPQAQAAAAAAARAWARAFSHGHPTPPPDPAALAAYVLGAIFACVGVGCLVGPLVMNAVVDTHPRSLMRAVGAAFALLAAGYAGLAASGGALGCVMAATALRSAGSATLWTYSSLLLQLTVPDGLLGRVSALEQIAFSLCESVSAGSAGLLFDVGGASVAGAAAAWAVVAAGVAAAWWRYVRTVGSLPTAVQFAESVAGGGGAGGGGVDAEVGSRAQQQQQQQQQQHPEQE
jgi:MFS family permease